MSLREKGKHVNQSPLKEKFTLIPKHRLKLENILDKSYLKDFKRYDWYILKYLDIDCPWCCLSVTVTDTCPGCSILLLTQLAYRMAESSLFPAHITLTYSLGVINSVDIQIIFSNVKWISSLKMEKWLKNFPARKQWMKINSFTRWIRRWSQGSLYW